MSSISLYRKWRPQTFSDLKGQDVIRDTLYYAVTHGQLSQAYLFCGPRGTGKTTTARLIAKVINCLAESGDKPCNSCSTCTSITNNANLDIIELDAASNRGIDEIRQLRDTVRFAPTQANYKVFIIDEVHMLTREAFNALLKTLEEPPSHVIFILATTEVHKIPPTIVSRCQRYDFRLATLDSLEQHVVAIAKEEQMKLTPDAARFIARLGEGSFRDALSLLEQVKAANQAEYTREVVEQLFGYIPEDHLVSCLGSILKGSLKEAHAQVDLALAKGADIKAFGEQLLAYSQSLLESVALEDYSGMPESLAAVAQSVGLRRLLGWVELLIAGLHEMKQCPIPRLPLDIAITKYATVFKSQEPTYTPTPIPNPPANKTTESGKTVAYVLQPPVASESSPVVLESPTPVHETVSVPVAVVLPETIEPENWKDILQELKKDAPSLVTSLVHGKVLGIESDTVKIAVRYKMHSDKINQVKNKLRIESAIAHVMGVPLKIEAQVLKEWPEETEEEVDLEKVFEFEE